MVKIISAFLCSDPSEGKLLHAKLGSEESMVDSWVATYNSYTIRRDLKERIWDLDSSIKNLGIKDVHSRTVINNITLQAVRPNEWKTDAIYKHYGGGDYAFIEDMQRLAALKDLLILGDPDYHNTWVFVSDVDEVLTEKSHGILSHILSNTASDIGALSVNRYKFIFNYNNLSSEVRRTPLVRLSWLIGNPFRRFAQSRRNNNFPVIDSKYAHCVEFHNCYNDMDGLTTKYKTFSHGGFTTDRSKSDQSRLNIDDLKWCLMVNCAVMKRKKEFNPDEFQSKLLESVPYSHELIPAYVSANSSIFHTGIVNENYSQIREFFKDKFLC